MLKVLMELKRVFPNTKFSLRYDKGIDRYLIMVNDYDLYFKEKKLLLWVKILKKRIPNVKFYCLFVREA